MGDRMKKLLVAGVIAGLSMSAAAFGADEAKPAATATAVKAAAEKKAEDVKADAKADAKKADAKVDAAKADAKADAKKADAKVDAAKDDAKKEVKKDEAKAKDAAASATGDWKVEGKTCKNLTNRECADATESFSAGDGTVYAWTKVVGPKDGGEIHHVWFKGDENMGDVTLKIGGSPWRTYSKKNLGDDAKGDWRVEIRDGSGAVLETLKFSVK